MAGRWTKAAQKVREAMNVAGDNLDDRVASETYLIFPTMKYDGALIKAGTRIQWDGQLKRAAVDLWDNEQSNPDNAPTLWEDIDYRNGVRVIPETVTAGLAFSKDELGWWKGDIYKSLIDSNVWNPDQYPQGWEKQ